MIWGSITLLIDPGRLGLFFDRAGAGGRGNVATWTKARGCPGRASSRPIRLRCADAIWEQVQALAGA